MSKILSFITFILFSSTAFAEEPSGSATVMSQLIMMAVFLGIFYVMIIKPQSKRAKEHQDLMSAIAEGDEVVTTAGMLGKIKKISNNFIVLEVNQGIEVNMKKSAIANVLSKGTIESI